MRRRAGAKRVYVIEERLGENLGLFIVQASNVKEAVAIHDKHEGGDIEILKIEKLSWISLAEVNDEGKTSYRIKTRA